MSPFPAILTIRRVAAFRMADHFISYETRKRTPMWLITLIGFFSIVQKPADTNKGTLTVRARVRSDLEALRQKYLPGMGEINESSSNDYRYRALVPRSEAASAMAKMVDALDYSNVKNEVTSTKPPALKWRAASFFWIIPWRCSNQSIAAYRSSSPASVTAKSSASVVVCHQRVVASLACGATMREATMASTRSRSRHGLEAISEAKPKRCIVVATASTWPCAQGSRNAGPGRHGWIGKLQITPACRSSAMSAADMSSSSL